MNNEDYKKKYETAVKKAEQLIEFYSRPEYKEILFYAREDLMAMFPEIKFKESEKIKQWLIPVVDRLLGTIDCPFRKQEVLDWLDEQNTVKWTEEDERLLTVCINAIDGISYFCPENKQELTEWLRSLRPESGQMSEVKQTDTQEKSIIVTNEKTQKCFYARHVVINRGNYNGQLYVSPTVAIIVKDVDDTVETLGRKYLGDESGAITKEKAIGDNEKINIKYCAADGTIEHEAIIFNAWIREVDPVKGIIKLDCDHVL